MSDILNKSSLMGLYPSVLDKDKRFNALGQSTAEVIGDAFLKTANADIYTRIGELEEGVLDILAKDFNITWYDYDFKVETKRRVIAAAFSVYRHFGTTGAMVTAICAIWPNSTVEEWFQYGGDPYYFKVMVQANDADGEPIEFSKIDRTVQLYKNERSWLEGGSVILLISCHVVIETKQNRQKFHSVLCGTQPRVTTHGNVANPAIIVGSHSEPLSYHTGHTGEDVSGTVPHSTTHGDISDGGLQVGADVGVSTYNSIPCGTPLGALM